MSRYICFFIVTVLINGINGVIYYLNESDYNRMPPIYKLDDYEACLKEPSDRYCTVELNLISNTTSELLNMIHEYSEHTFTHYNHTQLTQGICVTKRCQNYIRDRNMVSKKSLEACLNDTFMKKYSLSTQVTDFNCYSTSDAKEEFDTADQAVAIVLLVILMLNVFGSLYDLQSNERIIDNNFLLCFSIPRHWKRLISCKPNPDPRIESLKGINGIRCLILLGVLMTHSLWPFARAAENSRDVELMYYRVRENIIMSGPLTLQSNILISGFLLAYNMELYAENNKINWYILPKSFLLRYVRLTPVCVFIIALSSTWIKFIQRGPLWKMSEMVTHCRCQWWQHLLYINNYYYNSLCLMSAWYIAVDMQLFCLGIVLCVLLKKKTWRRPVLTSILVFGIIIIAVHTYVYDLNPIMIAAPEHAKTLFRSDPTFNETYKKGHTNIPSFIIGMMLGYSVYKWQKAGINITGNKKLRILYWALVPMGLAVIFSGELFYRDAPRDPLAVRVLYAAFSKPVFSSLMAMFIAGTIFNVDNVYRKLLEWQKWKIVRRLSYSMYILNLFILRVYISQRHSLLWFSEINMLITLAIITIISFLCAIPMYLLVEMPFIEIVKYYLHRNHLKKLTKNDCK